MKNTNKGNGVITLQKTVGNKTIKASFDGEHIWVVNGEGGQIHPSQLLNGGFIKHYAHRPS